MKQVRFRKILAEHKDQIYSHALYFLGNYQDAEDVTQEVLIRIWQNLISIRRGKEKAWVMRVTHNLCIDYARSRHKRSEVVLNENVNFLKAQTTGSPLEPDPAKLAQRSDFTEHILQALQKLPQKLKSVLMMREIQGLKYKEISQVLGMPINSVKVYIHQGREALRGLLKQSLKNEIE